jgi:hypothetical protein
MASDVREYLRAAQAAEIRGDKARAAEILRTVAGEYQKAGNDPRAQQMLRHAERLEGSPSQVPLPAPQLERAPEPSPEPRSAAVEARDDGARGNRRSRAADPEFAERGPALADPAAPAWCSFCCRPGDEVGPLVAGPAGAFICAACATESASLLGGASRSSSSAPDAARAQPSSEHQGEAIFALQTMPAPVAAKASAARSYSQPQRKVISALQTALREGAQLILLVGPEGSGKTTCLRSLQAQGLGDCVDTVDGASIGRGTLLLDRAETFSSEAFERLSRLLSSTGSPCILAVRGRAPSSGALLSDRHRRVELHPTGELARGTHGKIPHELLQRVQRVVVLPAPKAEDLSEMAKWLFEERGATASPELVAYIAAEALKSGHGGHELKALVDRVPRGAWRRVGGERRSRGSMKKKRRR